MNIKSLFYRIHQSFWYLPASYSLFAILLAYSSVQVDMWMEEAHIYRRLPTFLLTDRDTSRMMLTALATSILTMTSITFSSIMVVLSTYLAQYSPRTLDNFLTDTVTRRVLGIFIGSFFYFLLLLVWMNVSDLASFLIVPSLSVIVTGVCLGFFVYFIHHIGTWIQVNNLIQDITDNCLTILKKHEQDRIDMKSAASSPWASWEVDELKNKLNRQAFSKHSGFIQHVNLQSIIRYASQNDLLIKMERTLGDYVEKGSVLFSYWSLGDHPYNINTYVEQIRIGPQRVTDQDLEFGIQKLTEIALRAISPAVNDPYTAIISIQRLGKILTRFTQTSLDEPYLFDRENNLRIVLKVEKFSHILYKSFYQVRHYGKQDVSVLAAIFDSLTLIAENSEKPVKDSLWTFAGAVCEGMDRSALIKLDYQYLRQKLEVLAKLTGHHNEKGYL